MYWVITKINNPDPILIIIYRSRSQSRSLGYDWQLDCRSFADPSVKEIIKKKRQVKAQWGDPSKQIWTSMAPGRSQMGWLIIPTSKLKKTGERRKNSALKQTWPIWIPASEDACWRHLARNHLLHYDTRLISPPFWDVMQVRGKNLSFRKFDEKVVQFHFTLGLSFLLPLLFLFYYFVLLSCSCLLPRNTIKPWMGRLFPIFATSTWLD